LPNGVWAHPTMQAVMISFPLSDFGRFLGLDGAANLCGDP
jgi:hypothetical protein